MLNEIKNDIKKELKKLRRYRATYLFISTIYAIAGQYTFFVSPVNASFFDYAFFPFFALLWLILAYLNHRLIVKYEKLEKFISDWD